MGIFGEWYAIYVLVCIVISIAMGRMAEKREKLGKSDAASYEWAAIFVALFGLFIAVTTLIAKW